MKEVKKSNSIKAKKCRELLLKTKADVNLWMNIYLESEPFDLNLKIQKTQDMTIDKIELHTKLEYNIRGKAMEIRYDLQKKQRRRTTYDAIINC